MPVNRERKMICAQAQEFDIEFMSLQSVAELVKNLIDTYGPDATIGKQDYQHEDGYYFAVMIDRPETDKEMAKRISDEEFAEEVRAMRDREEYERLKKKFG